MKYRTTKDIIIPAGTELAPAPHRIDRGSGFLDAIIGPTKDTHFTWTIHAQDALDAGLIEAA